MTPKIGINALFLDPGRGGGMERYLTNMTAALARLHPKSALTAFTNRSNAGLFSGAIREVRAPVSARIRPARILWEQAALPAMAIREKCDALISFGNIGPVLSPHPSILVMHDLIPFAWPSEFSALEGATARRLFAMSAATAEKIVTVSRFSQNQIIRRLNVPARKTAVIPGGCDLAFWRQDPDFSPGPVQDQWSQGRPFILASASAKPHKNLDGLLQVFRLLLGQFAIKEHLVIVHNAGTEERMAQGIREAGLEGRVTVSGPVSDLELRRLYRAARAFIFPSLYEGFGLPVLEAMACGAPVAALRTASLPEAAGDAALLTRPGAPGEMAQAVADILGAPGLRESLAAKGIKRAAEFSWERGARRMLALALELAGGRT